MKPRTAFNAPGLLKTVTPAIGEVKGNRFFGGGDSHPEYNLGPSKIISIYRQAEAGRTQLQCDLFDGVVENDGHLRAAIAARTLMVTGASWQIQAGDDSPQSIVAAEMLAEVLRSSNFEKAMEHMLGARYFGYSATEIVWAMRDGNIVPEHFIAVPARRIGFSHRTSEPVLRTNEYGDDDQPLMPGKWIFVDNCGSMCTRIARSGLLRTATWFSLFKRWSWRDWVIYAEKFGIPGVLGVYENNDNKVGEDEIEALRDAVRSIGEDGQAIISNEVEIRTIDASRTGNAGDLHNQIVGEANTEISKLITGATLNAESGGPGSFALGKVHESRAFFFIKADAQKIQRHFSEELSRRFIEFNGFDKAKAPRLKIHISQTDDPGSRMKLYESAYEMGVPFDVEQFREEFQFRAPPNGARNVVGDKDE